MIFKFVKLVVRSIFHILYDIEFIGIDKLPEKGAFIICANHISIMDPILLVAFVRRNVRFMAKHELYKIPLLGSILTAAGAFPVNRESVEITSIKHALGLLKNGEVMGIFAQGGRVASEVDEDSGKAGVAMFAVRASAPVVPIGIKGNYRPFTRMVINIGEPMYFQEEEGKKMRSAELSVLTKQIMAEMKKLADTNSRLKPTI